MADKPFVPEAEIDSKCNFNMVDISILEQSSELCIGALSQAILDDIARYEQLHDKEPKILDLTAELRMDIKFIMMDLNTSFLATCKAKEAYACRYHLKNLEAEILETYKLLLNYGKSKKYTVLKKIGVELTEDPVSNWAEQGKLIADYQTITDSLNGLAGDAVAKQHRGLTYNYDADMRQVYEYTVSTNNTLSSVLCLRAESGSWRGTSVTMSSMVSGSWI